MYQHLVVGQYVRRLAAFRQVQLRAVASSDFPPVVHLAGHRHILVVLLAPMDTPAAVFALLQPGPKGSIIGKACENGATPASAQQH